jgi:hypothetical protein
MRCSRFGLLGKGTARLCIAKRTKRSERPSVEFWLLVLVDMLNTDVPGVAICASCWEKGSNAGLSWNKYVTFSCHTPAPNQWPQDDSGYYHYSSDANSKIRITCLESLPFPPDASVNSNQLISLF